MLQGTDTLLGPVPPESEYLEAYRQLRASIFALQQQWEMRSILVTSAMQGEGKSTVAANLATVLALADKSTILADMDLRQPVLHDMINESLAPGMTDVLAGWAAVSEVIRPTGVEHLSIITAGSHAAQGSDIIAGQGTGGILATLAEQYEFIIVDTTPVLDFSAALDLGPLVDCVVMVARARRSIAPVAQAMKMLEQVGAKVPGVVVNDVLPQDRVSAEYGYYES